MVSPMDKDWHGLAWYGKSYGSGLERLDRDSRLGRIGRAR